MNETPQRVVSVGYDEVADAYLDRFGVSTVRQRWFERLVESLPLAGARVLDLGCGAGVPVARQLVALGHTVTGVDGSSQQIAKACRNVPQATFIEADMCSVAFEEDTFDAVGAFYSITHVPPAQQAGLLASIAQWLKPRGKLVASFGSGSGGEWAGQWLGTTMYFGHASEDETLRWLADAGLLVRHATVEKQDNEDAAFLWIEAIKFD